MAEIISGGIYSTTAYQSISELLFAEIMINQLYIIDNDIV